MLLSSIFSILILSASNRGELSVTARSLLSCIVWSIVSIVESVCTGWSWVKMNMSNQWLLARRSISYSDVRGALMEPMMQGVLSATGTMALWFNVKIIGSILFVLYLSPNCTPWRILNPWNSNFVRMSATNRPSQRTTPNLKLVNCVTVRQFGCWLPPMSKRKKVLMLTAYI